MKEDFAESSLRRLQKLLAGRQPYPWGRSVGIARGTIGRMLSGAWPDPSRLVQMCRMESVSLSWLIAGEGAPFTVDRCTDPDACIDILGRTEELAHAIVLRSPKGAALLTADRCHDEAAGYQWFRWTLCTATAITAESISSLMPKLTHGMRATRSLELSRAKFGQLLRGEAGTFALLGSPDTPAHDAWINDAEVCTGSDVITTLRNATAAPYPPASTRISEPRPQDIEAAQLFSQCTSSQQLALLEVLRGLSSN